MSGFVWGVFWYFVFRKFFSIFFFDLATLAFRVNSEGGRLPRKYPAYGPYTVYPLRFNLSQKSLKRRLQEEWWLRRIFPKINNLDVIKLPSKQFFLISLFLSTVSIVFHPWCAFFRQNFVLFERMRCKIAKKKPQERLMNNMMRERTPV